VSLMRARKVGVFSAPLMRAFGLGMRRDCAFQPMLMRRELLSGGLLAEEFVELTLERAGLLLVRLRLSMRKANSEMSPSVGMQPLRRFPFSKVGAARIGFPSPAARVGPRHLDDGRWSRFSVL
jgi:hypothetical protein